MSPSTVRKTGGLAGLAASPGKVAGVLACVVVGLVLASVLGQLCKDYFGLGNVFGLPDLFDVKLENNVPTWYSAAALLACAVLSLKAAFAERTGRDLRNARWYVLATIFAYLCVDELFKIHETLGPPLGRRVLGTLGLNPHDVFLRAWVIYGGALVIVVGLICLWLFSGLPSRTLWLFVFAGALYAFAAIGLELFYQRLELLYGRENARGLQILYTSLEEFLEMIAVVIMIYALLSYLKLSPARKTRRGDVA